MPAKAQPKTTREKRQAARIRKLEQQLKNALENQGHLFDQLHKHQKNQPAGLTAAQQARIETLKLSWPDWPSKKYVPFDKEHSNRARLRYCDTLVEWILTGKLPNWEV